MSKIVHVVAGVLIDQQGRFLLGSRPEGKPYAGYWEFPGGKIEQGESEQQALARELMEEMGITVQQATPWLSKHFDYPHASVSLRFYRIWTWEGQLQSREGQQFTWQNSGILTVDPMLPANGPVLRALALPEIIFQTTATQLDQLSSQHQPRNSWLLLDQLPECADQLRLAGNKFIISAFAPNNMADGVLSPITELSSSPDVKPADWRGTHITSAEELLFAAESGCDFAIASSPDLAPEKLLSKGMPIPLLWPQPYTGWRDAGLHGYLTEWPNV